jgi:formylglycine-generating enzyme required for sulfatase activity
VRVAAINNGEFLVAWEPVGAKYSAHDTIDIEQSTNSSNYYLTKSIPAPLTQTTLTGPFDTTITYYFRLRLRTPEGRSPYSEAVGCNIEQENNVSAAGGALVLVQGGTFTMGSPEGEGEFDERPQHTVTLSTFRIGATEVTRSLWREVVQWKQGSATEPLNPDPAYHKNIDNAPVERVSWEEVQVWLGYLNEKAGITQPGRMYRLPTEAEWEYAARGGASGSAHTIYSGSDTAEAVAWYAGNSGGVTHVVGTKRPNSLGLYDMSGNVWEWCMDRFGKYYDGGQRNPTGPSEGTYRIVRGGSWLLDHGSARVANRNINPPAWRGSCVGFRLARGL